MEVEKVFFKRNSDVMGEKGMSSPPNSQPRRPPRKLSDLALPGLRS